MRRWPMNDCYCRLVDRALRELRRLCLDNRRMISSSASALRSAPSSRAFSTKALDCSAWLTLVFFLATACGYPLGCCEECLATIW